MASRRGPGTLSATREPDPQRAGGRGGWWPRAGARGPYRRTPPPPHWPPAQKATMLESPSCRPAAPGRRHHRTGHQPRRQQCLSHHRADPPHPDAATTAQIKRTHVDVRLASSPLESSTDGTVNPGKSNAPTLMLGWRHRRWNRQPTAPSTPANQTHPRRNVAVTGGHPGRVTNCRELRFPRGPRPATSPSPAATPVA